MNRRTHFAIAVVLFAAAAALAVSGSDPAAPAMAGDDRPDAHAQTAEPLTAEALAGAEVYGPDGRRIGAVGDVMIDPAGAVEGAIVVSGGVLGIGERRVAVPLDRLAIERTADGAGVRVVSRLSAAEIAALPEFP